MYLRRTQRRRKDGSVVGYVQLAHNRRVDGVTRAEVLLNLGREDELDMDGLRRLAASIVRFTDGEGASGPLDAVAAREGDALGGLEVDSSRALGGVWLLDALWRRLGVSRRARQGARSAAVHHGCGARAVRDGRQPCARSVLEAGVLGMGDRGCRDRRAGRDRRGSLLSLDGPAGRG